MFSAGLGAEKWGRLCSLYGRLDQKDGKQFFPGTINVSKEMLILQIRGFETALWQGLAFRSSFPCL